VDCEIWPVYELLVDLCKIGKKKKVGERKFIAVAATWNSGAYLFKSFGVIVREFYLLPHASRCMCSLDCFNV
jgi:hypothetical protein